MRNIKLIIMYDGSHYFGWQKLGDKNKKTIQGELEAAIYCILGENVDIIGSGRTDTGVHALGQVANFRVKSNISTEEIKVKLNLELAKSIKIVDVEEVPLHFHSRYDAIAKTYSYRIDNGEIPSVFTRKHTTAVPYKLDVPRMREAARYLVGEHDFTSFSSAMKGNRTTVREIYSIDIEQEGQWITIRIRGNGFLYNMVRILVGTLVDVGFGKMKPEQMTGIIEAKNRALAGPTLSSQGLFLESVEYPSSKII